jgi:hypothetical protein
MSEWKLIETAPKDGTRVMIVIAENIKTVCVAYWSKGCDAWMSIPGCWSREATHWMPIPAPPKTES